MIVRLTTLALTVGVLLLASCSDSEIDPTVQFDMEPAPRQPWVATGELVGAGHLCPEGYRDNVDLAYPDGSPMTLDELLVLYHEAEEAGGSLLDVDFRSWEEYLCSDGSGTFTIKEESGDGGTGEVVGGTGAYVEMTGECTFSLTEDRTGDETVLLEISSTCEFDMGSLE